MTLRTALGSGLALAGLIQAMACPAADGGATIAPSLVAAASGPSCTAGIGETPLGSAAGSAGIMYNMAEHPESIRVQARTLLTEAVDKIGTAPAGAAPSIVFRVSPMVYLPDAEQQPLCRRLADETRAQPLRYRAHDFADVAALDDWIMQFSQGHGEDGTLLYKQCGGNCDPSFTFVIGHAQTGLHVDTEVWCGYARDRSNNMYSMTTTLRSSCAAGPH